MTVPTSGSDERVRAVIFDLDGVLLDSESIWDGSRRQVVDRHGGCWQPSATLDMMGMSSREWSSYMHDHLGVLVAPERIAAEVVELVDRRYAAQLPLLPGARDAVVRLAERWLVGLASSANRVVIERFLDASGLRPCFAATVSSEEVEQGKPAPDVYLAAAAALNTLPQNCVAIEDSTNGIHAAHAAATTVIAVPNREFPPSDDAIALARVVLPNLMLLTPDRVEAAAVAGP
jgi:HAD superfamily hydrolase (TIGR01509 family)